MMRLWEERVKFTFGHPGMDEDEYEVIVPGDHVHPKIEEGFHTISKYATIRICFLFNSLHDLI